MPLLLHDQLITTMVILGIYWSHPCDKPLRWFLLWLSGRHLILLPLSISRYNAARRQDFTTAASYHQASSWLNVAVFVLFIVGQTWLYSSQTCSATAPGLYYYTMVLIILFYLTLALPLVILVGLCLCMPCILLALRLMQEDPGASDQVINQLPKKTFDGTQAASSDGTAPSCAVCMEDYKVGDQIRVLPCQHEFHAACVDVWLKTKRACPLCRADITRAPAAAESV